VLFPVDLAADEEKILAIGVELQELVAEVIREENILDVSAFRTFYPSQLRDFELEYSYSGNRRNIPASRLSWKRKLKNIAAS
jgi:hypothetical protein